MLSYAVSDNDNTRRVFIVLSFIAYPYVGVHSGPLSGNRSATEHRPSCNLTFEPSCGLL